MRGHTDTEWIGWYVLNHDLTLKPLAAVYANLAKTFDKAQAVGTQVGLTLPLYIETGGPWTDKDGAVWLPLWTQDAKLTTILRTYTPPANVAVYDLYGGLISASTATVAIGPTPVLIKSLTTSKADLLASIAIDGNYAVRPDTTGPKLSLAYAPRGPFTAGKNVRFRWLGIDPDAITDGTAEVPQERVTYSWKLTGVDADWTVASADNYVEYAGVGAGDYVFGLKATNEALITTTHQYENGERVAILSSVLPTGDQSCTTYPVELTLSAVSDTTGTTCKYCQDGVDGCDSATTYAAMAGIFDTTGTTTHSETISVACGVSHTFHIKCSVDGGGVNASSTVATFNVENIATPSGIEIIYD